MSSHSKRYYNNCPRGHTERGGTSKPPCVRYVPQQGSIGRGLSCQRPREFVNDYAGFYARHERDLTLMLAQRQEMPTDTVSVVSGIIALGLARLSRYRGDSLRGI